jgi:hypothetical protein
MKNTSICKYCKGQILWVDRNPFELDGQIRHTFDLCTQTRKANKSAKRKQVRLDQKKSFEGVQAQFPIGSYIITYRNSFPEKARYVPVGLVVARAKFKSKNTPHLVVKRLGHGDHEEELNAGGKVVTRERYEEVLKAEIDHRIAETINIGRFDNSFEGKLYLQTTNLVDGSTKDLSEPWFFWERLWVETAKKVLEENNNKQAENNACQSAS